jgi:hypothetical protein
MWYIVRDRIMNKKVEIRRVKQKGGPDNVQDIELEMNEAESGKTRKEERKEKRAAKQAERKLNKSIKNGGTNV